MTFTFTTPADARQEKLGGMGPLIARINKEIAAKEGRSFSIPFAEAGSGDIDALTPMLNESGWNARLEAVNGSDKFSGDGWLFEVFGEQPPDDATGLTFMTPAQARKGMEGRLKALVDKIQSMIKLQGGTAFSIPAMQTRMEDIEALRPDLLKAGWKVRRIPNDGYGDDTWLFEPRCS